MSSSAGDFATGFFGGVANKMNDHLAEQRDNERRRQDAVSQMYVAILQNPYSSPEQRQAAMEAMEKLYPKTKGIKEAFQKFGQIFHLGHKITEAQQQQEQGPMSEKTPIGGSSTNPPPAATQPNANIMAPQVPAKAGPTPPPEAASLFPALASAPKGGGPTPPPPTAQAQAPPGAASPKGAGGRTPNRDSKTASFPTGNLATAVSPTEEQLLESYRKRQDIAADAAAKKSVARRAPTTLGEWIEAYKAEHDGKGPSAQEIIDFQNKTHASGQTPMKLKEAEYFKLMTEGKTEEAQAVLKQMSDVKTAEKGKAPTGTSLLATIRQSIDPNANPDDRKLAQSAIAEWNKLLTGQQMARGKGYAMYRAMYQLNTWLDPTTGEQVPMSNFDAAQRIKNGASLVQVGHLSANQVSAAQKFVAESVPAIKEVRDYLKAYDNESDKLVFARVMDELGPAPSGEEVSWVGNVLDQALQHSELSPEARKLIPRLIRLKETVGSLRQSLGAPATDSSMALMLALIPGPTTPDAAYARDLLDQFEQNARNSVAVPFLKPAVSGMTGTKGKLGPKAQEFLKNKGVSVGGGGPTPPPPASQ